MLGLQDDPDALGCDVELEPVGDLLGESLLDLEVPGEQLDDAGELGEPEDATVGDVADMGNAVERQEMVLAQRLERDVAGEDDDA